MLSVESFVLISHCLWCGSAMPGVAAACRDVHWRPTRSGPDGPHREGVAVQARSEHRGPMMASEVGGHQDLPLGHLEDMPSQRASRRSCVAGHWVEQGAGGWLRHVPTPPRLSAFAYSDDELDVEPYQMASRA